MSFDRHNVTNRLVASLSGGHDLERLDLSRLRATWLATVAETRLGLPGLFKAAGFSFSQQLCDLVADLNVPDDDDLVDLLGLGLRGRRLLTSRDRGGGGRRGGGRGHEARIAGGGRPRQLSARTLLVGICLALSTIGRRT